jgi:hypothetical protein
MKATRIITIGAAAMLAACGGGGGDSGTTSTTSGTTTAATSVLITSNNATDISAYSYSALEDVNSQSNISSSFVAGVSVDALPTGLLQSALNQLYKGVTTQASSNVATGVTVTRSAACAGGGFATVTVNASGSTQVQSGDSLTISASNCYEDGELINGRVDFVFTSVNGAIGSTSAWSAGMNMAFYGFSVQSYGATVQANGNINLSYAQNGYGSYASQLSGTSFSVDMARSDGSVLKRTLSNYKLASSMQAGVSTFSGDFTLTGSSPKLGAVSFTVKTISPFKSTAASRNPYTGSLIITGASGSSATVTAVDNANVRVVLDKNGDGVADDTFNNSWDSLRSHL